MHVIFPPIVFLRIKTFERSDDPQIGRFVAVKHNQHQRWDVVAKSKRVDIRYGLAFQFLQRHPRPIVRN